MKKIKIVSIITILMAIFMVESAMVTAEVHNRELYEQVETKDETQELQNETTVKYYVVTFIDDIRNTKVEKKIREGEKVTLESVETEIIWINETDYYEFFEWKKSNGEVYDFNVPVTGDITIYASYFLNVAEKNYANRLVTFDTQGGSNVESQSVGSKEKYYINKPKNPTKIGYKFLGWYTKKDDGEKWNFSKNKVYENMTLYAHWQYIGNSNLISPKTGYNLQLTLMTFMLGISALGLSFIKIKEK